MLNAQVFGGWNSLSPNSCMHIVGRMFMYVTEIVVWKKCQLCFQKAVVIEFSFIEAFPGLRLFMSGFLTCIKSVEPTNWRQHSKKYMFLKALIATINNIAATYLFIYTYVIINIKRVWPLMEFLWRNIAVTLE